MEFIRINGVLFNASNISSITPHEQLEIIEVAEGEEPKKPIVHYGVKLGGTIPPEHIYQYFDTQKARNEFMDQFDRPTKTREPREQKPAKEKKPAAAKKKTAGPVKNRTAGPAKKAAADGKKPEPKSPDNK